MALTVPITGRDHIRGAKKAPVMLLEYGDYECPFCGKAYYVIQRLLAEHGDKVTYAFRNFPLTHVHPNALPAALAAEAAGLQKKFWQMHDMLFENQSLLDEEYLIAYADEIGLDVKRFAADMISEEITARVQEDIDSGVESGVNSTPTFFLNGKAYDGPYDYGILSAVIERVATDSPYKKVDYDHALSHSI